MTAPTLDPALEATRQTIRRLARALAARDRCAAMATHATVRATLAKTLGVRLDWQELADGYRETREEWNDQIRDLRRALRD